MIKKLWDNILNQSEVRQSLSKIRQEIKDFEKLQQMSALAKGKESVLIGLLAAADAKTRKNAALLMGDLGHQDFMEPVWQAYHEETQRFVKSAYLVALANFDYRIYLTELKEQLAQLQAIELTVENEKHITAEMRELSSLIVNMEGVQKHPFTGWDKPCKIVLLTNRNFTDLVSEELRQYEPEAAIKPVGAGIMAQVESLNWLKEIRVYQEVLFLIPGMKTCRMEPLAVAKSIAESDMLTFLSERHQGKAPYYFRLEMKSRRSLGEKSAFLKKLAAQIEKGSDRKLINSTNRYEFEIRLIENKEGNCNLMVKLFTLKDRRFNYRKEMMPTSIKPVNAALTVALAKDYMKEGAQVLDPFCGVGTMLIERHKAVQANTTYGLDIQEEAICKAQENTETAGQVIHYINRNFFSFTHEYLFDEIITEMPFQIGRMEEEDVEEVYQEFFKKAPEHLKDGAIVILYSRDREIVRRMAARTDFCILESYEISRKEETYVFILRYR